MIVVERTMLVKKEHTSEFDKIFTAPCPMKDIPGFIRRTVYRKPLQNDFEEYRILVLFEDEAALKRWSDSGAPEKQRELRKDLFQYLIEETKTRVHLVKELHPTT